MQDLFARIGSVLGHLLFQSTVNGPAKDDALRLIEELKEADISIDAIIADRVRAATEEMAGRVAALETGARTLSDQVFGGAEAAEPAADAPAGPETTTSPESTSGAETTATVEGGAGADSISPLDHDGDGEPGGSLPAEPTDDPMQMTVAQLKTALDALGVEYPSGALKADLQALLLEAIKDAGAGDETQTAPAGAELKMVSGGGTDVIG